MGLPKSTGLTLRLKGVASLVHIHNPLPNCDTDESTDEYYARIRADNGSIFGSRDIL